ncbi:MAG: divalent-cation tolerance protein CutA [Candidatus Thorarchaeota archaeon]
MTKYIIAISTCKNEDAERISRLLVDSRKCACVNIIKGIRSIYHWKGNVEDEEECILLMKTEADMEDELSELLFRIHSYETPEFITIPIRTGSLSYLEWLSSNLA